MKRLFSGIQPTGNLHLGNYLGAVKNWVSLQEDYEAIFCVVDLHAITVPQEPEKLRKNIIDTARVYLASGIDPKKATIFVQSEVSAHSELAWILNTITQNGDLTKMTQFKDKNDFEMFGAVDLNNKNSKKKFNSTKVGLFDYPVLMTADILLYDTEVVPVGEDQTQHLELARTLARRFNKQFGEMFVVPKSYVKEEGMRIMGLDDPTKKMSKSATSEYNYIALSDDIDIIRKKIKKAVTDSGTDITYSDDRPALKNLLNIYHLLSGKDVDVIVEMYEGKGFGDFKNDLAEVVVTFIKPLQVRMAEISDDDVRAVLATGAERATVIATEKIRHIKHAVGLGQV